MDGKPSLKSEPSGHVNHVNFVWAPPSQSQSQYETCVAPLIKLNSGIEQTKTLKHTIKIKK